MQEHIIQAVDKEEYGVAEVLMDSIKAMNGRCKTNYEFGIERICCDATDQVIYGHKPLMRD